MRIHLKTSPNTTPVPFDYQQKLVGTIHKWIGNNSIHDKIFIVFFLVVKRRKKSGQCTSVFTGCNDVY